MTYTNVVFRRNNSSDKAALTPEELRVKVTERGFKPNYTSELPVVIIVSVFLYCIGGLMAIIIGISKIFSSYVVYSGKESIPIYKNGNYIAGYQYKKVSVRLLPTDEERGISKKYGLIYILIGCVPILIFAGIVIFY